MKKATIIHTETITQYFQNGIEVTPTAEEKLLNAIFNTLEIKTTTFINELEVVSYKNKKELDEKFWDVANRFAYYVHPNDLSIGN